MASRRSYAAGTVGCSGLAKICTPRWTAPVPAGDSIAVANGVAYLGRTEFAPGGPTTVSLVAIDATGTTGCAGAPKVVCTLVGPRRGLHLRPPAAGSPATGDRERGGVHGRTRRGRQGVRRDRHHGLLRISEGLHATLEDLAAGQAATGSVVANGVLFTNTGVYDATGTQGCAGVPKICQPIATVTTTPLIANGRAVYTTGGSTPAPHFDIRIDRVP